jgi:hypothetical protein
MRYACRTGYHERCPGRWCTCPCHREHAMRPTEWTPDAGPHDAPSGQEEAEARPGGHLPLLPVPAL